MISRRLRRYEATEVIAKSRARASLAVAPSSPHSSSVLDSTDSPAAALISSDAICDPALLLHAAGSSAGQAPPPSGRGLPAGVYGTRGTYACFPPRSSIEMLRTHSMYVQPRPSVAIPA